MPVSHRVGLVFRNPLVWICLGGLLLRLLLCLTVGLNPEDSLRLTLARSTSLDPRSSSFLLDGEGLALGGLSLLKVSQPLFGDQILLLRLPWIVAGVGTLWILYHLVQKALGPLPAIMATFLLAVDQYHFTWTTVFYANVLVMAQQVLLFWVLWKGLTSPKSQIRWFLWIGLLFGVGYYTKPVFLLLMLPVVLFLVRVLPDERYKVSLLPSFLAAILTGAALILPALWWAAQHPMEDPARYIRITTLEPFSGINLAPLSLYLGELFHAIRPGCLEDYWNWHGYPVHWVAGILYLSAVVWTFFTKRRDPFMILMLLTFFTVSMFFLFIDAGLLVNLFWWPFLSLLPAVVMAGDLLATLWKKAPIFRGAIVILGVYLTLHLATVNRGGYDYPLLSADEWRNQLVESGLQAMTEKNFPIAYQDLLWASKLDPADPQLKQWLTHAYGLAARQKIR